MKTKITFLFIIFIIVNSKSSIARGVAHSYHKHEWIQLSGCFHQSDTTKKPTIQTANSSNLQSKILGIWKEVGAENATFEIKLNIIYYFEHDASYKYTLKGNVMAIKFPGYIFTGKVSFVKETMIISSQEFGVSKYKRMK